MKNIKIALVVFASIITSFTGSAQEGKTDISVDFKIRNFGLNVNGFFGDVSIENNFSSEDISKWILEGVIKVSSIKTGIEKRDKHLLEDDYFNANIYPEIKLVTTNFREVSKNNYDVTANLTIKKTTKSITIPIEIVDSESSMKLQTYFEINRKDFGVGGSSFSMSNTVKVTVNCTLIKQ